MKQRLIYAFLFATTLVLLPLFSLFYGTKQEVNDALYQKTAVTNPDICIIGIDAESIDTLGSFPFDRSIFAELVEILHSGDSAPLVVAMDVLFTGETNPTSDQALVDQLANRDNIILACSGNYGSSLVIEADGTAYLAQSQLLSMNYPFPDLLQVATLGHINSSLDQDGILRQAILNIQNEQGEVLPSLSLAMYAKYCQFHQIPLENLPENNWYLPFTAKTGGYYDGYSLSKVLSGEIPSSVFADKMVLVGPYTIGLQDHFFTAIDHNNLMFGVEYQANALEVLINKQFITEISPLYQNLFLFFSLFLLFVETLHLKLRYSGLILFCSAFAYVLLCRLLYQMGYLTDVFYLPLGCFFLFLLHIVVNALTESIEKAKVTATFKRYVAPEVVDQIFREGLDQFKLGGSTMDVSVMFIDVRNFTPMSERFSAEIVVDILNQLLNSMADTIMKNGGTLDKFIGDAIMCFWGAPLPQQDYIYQSVKTAVEITENLQEIIENIEKQYNHQVSVGIGIQCGKAVVGNIGSENRMDFTVIGDTVNTAARLEANAKGGHNVINISHDVYEKVKADFLTEEIPGGLSLKGKEGIFRAYRVLGFRQKEA